MNAASSVTEPSWDHCGEGVTAADLVGCRGIRVGSDGRCLAHLPDSDRVAYLTALAPGSDLDLRGTTIDETLLSSIRAACTDRSTTNPRFGRTDFTESTFTGDARFYSATFTGDAKFELATFTGDAGFDAVTFSGDAKFESATFTGDAEFHAVDFIGHAEFDAATFVGDAKFHAAFTGGARFAWATFRSNAQFISATFTSYTWFNSATFVGDAMFNSATFSGSTGFDSATFRSDARFRSTTFTSTAGFGSATFRGSAEFDSATFTSDARFNSATFRSDARFDSATFTGNAWFDSAVFTGDARFDLATFAGNALFRSAAFEGLQHLGPMTCAGEIRFDGARFTGTQVTVEAAALSLVFERAAFEGSVVLRLRYATVVLSRASLAAPMALQAWPVPFRTVLDESLLANGDYPPGVRLASLDGVDAAHLVLTDVNLDECRFTGAFHLDQIRIEFGCRFAAPPTGWRRWGVLPARWSRRKVLAEEQHWRLLMGGRAGRGWLADPHHGVPGLGAGPEDLAGVYQQLRKAFEEAGNEPDAADFYYGEMEMRRHDRQRPRAERRLLWAYWLASGYGLRASRALSWLVAAMGVTLLLMMLFGLPDDSPVPQTNGTYGAGVVKVSTKTPDPVLTLPVRQRVSTARVEKAALVVVNSVVFRSSGQNLTLPGTVIEMASRIGEPVLLGLAALAVRSRVKR
ncbi:pentapeptide repeat-containing protein [Kitasatospora sp. NPDC008115]|uniref:pentapeptide repeat-containing protein n=1 Tax=Kitasatospora sp. NPDC008115 TaxID=3364022 RepID=UPI0036E71263